MSLNVVIAPHAGICAGVQGNPHFYRNLKQIYAA